MTHHTEDDISCADVIRSVWDYLDGEIDVDRKHQIRAHLEICDHCREHYTFEGAFLRSVSGLLDDDGEIESLRLRIESALVKHGFSKRT